MSQIKITKQDVDKMAKLAKLDVTGQEEKFAELFTDTLAKVEVLNELNTKNVEETFQVTGLTNVFQQAHDNKATLTKHQALENGSEIINGLFATKGVFDRSS
jgi:aspartyl-tRNA(Asn)/glutamyl-tRNA(Gln) amidotransferase subunit C